MPVFPPLSAALVAALIACAAAATAQDEPYDFQPVTAPIAVTRGVMQVDEGQESYWLNKTDTCKLAMTEWGWGSCDSIDAFVILPFAGVDTVLVEKANTDGYVKMDDWNSSERADVIAEIENNLRAGSTAQGQALGQVITFDGWLVEPTLNTEKNYLYYASRFTWNGQPQVNIKATVFDRRGYVPFSIIPVEQSISPDAVQGMINATLDHYTPNETEAYAAFSTGDTVAAVGAVGVLAGLAGLQYSKGAAGGLIAAALLILKKAWILLIAPFVWVKSKFGRKKGGPEA